MVVKGVSDRHFTKPFGEGSFSHRVILPERDASRVTVTEFHGKQGQKFEGVVYPVDETVRIVDGIVAITWGDRRERVVLGLGTTYHVPAGEVYSVECVEDVTAVCFFSQAADGTLPQNEDNPADAPPCSTCGSVMIGSGTLWKCVNCGNTTRRE